MSPNTLVPEMEGAVGEGMVADVGVSVPVEEEPGPMVRVPDFTPCYNYAESVNPCSIPGGSYFVEPFSSTRIARNTYP